MGLYYFGLLRRPALRGLSTSILDSAYVSPTREQGFRVFANGVVDELVIDYGDFTIDAVLEDLKPLPESGC